jgi:hypothetical protein
MEKWREKMTKIKTPETLSEVFTIDDYKTLVEDKTCLEQKAFIKAAKEKLCGMDDFDTDEKPEVSIGDDGAYVQTWIYVSNKEAGLED